MKKVFLWLLVVIVAVSMVAGVATAQEKPKIAIVLKTLANDFWVAMKEGIEAEAKIKGYAVDIFAVASEADIEGQLKLLEVALVKDYKGIGVAPISPVNLIPGIVKANAKGIPVVNIDERVDPTELKNAGGYIIAYVTTDNFAVGQKGATFIVGQLGADGGKVAIIEGMAGNASGNDRKDGASDIFGKNPNIKLVASQPADWDRVRALDVATNIIQGNPDLKAFYCCNDTMALGALEAVKASKKQIIVVGTDGIPEAVASVKAGEMGATVAQDPAKVGATSYDILVDAIEKNLKGSLDAKPAFVSVDSLLITK